MRIHNALRSGFADPVSDYKFDRDSEEGEFANLGTGPIRGGLLFASVPGHLRDEFGPTCVVLEYRDGSDRVFRGDLADLLRESIIGDAAPAFGLADLNMAG